MSEAQSQKGRVRVFNPSAVFQGLRGAPGLTQPRPGPPEDHEASPVCGRGWSCSACCAACPPHLLFHPSFCRSADGSAFPQCPPSFPLSLAVSHGLRLSIYTRVRRVPLSCDRNLISADLRPRGCTGLHNCSLKLLLAPGAQTSSGLFPLRPLALFSSGPDSLLLRQVLCLVTGGLCGSRVLVCPSQSYGRRTPIKILISLA